MKDTIQTKIFKSKETPMALSKTAVAIIICESGAGRRLAAHGYT